MAEQLSIEQQGSDKSPGVLLIAYHLPSGAAYCIVDNTLLTMPLDVDGQLQIDRSTTPNTLDWGECVQLGREFDEPHLRSVIEALGHSFEQVYEAMPFR